MTDNTPTIVAIAALTKAHRGIGKDRDMPWDIPADLKRFERLTSGHPVIMGRKTWNSLPFRPLPDRTNIVLTRTKDFSADGAIVCHSLEAALAAAREKDGERIFIMGGGQIYETAMPYVDRLELTIIHEEYGCDTFFPSFQEEFKEVAREEHRGEDPPFDFCTFKRI